MFHLLGEHQKMETGIRKGTSPRRGKSGKPGTSHPTRWLDLRCRADSGVTGDRPGDRERPSWNLPREHSGVSVDPSSSGSNTDADCVPTVFQLQHLLRPLPKRKAPLQIGTGDDRSITKPVPADKPSVDPGAPECVHRLPGCVNQRAKLTRNWGETAPNFDHPLKSVILRFFTGVTWDCYAWKPLPRFVAVMK